jgi:CheY-like chemotaxis protein
VFLAVPADRNISPPSGPRAEPAAAAVLALTDDPEVRDLLLELAIAEGFGVRCAASAEEAGEILDLEQPGLLLVDLDMSGRAGTKFLRSFRQGPLGRIPCVAVTGSNDPMLAVTVDASIFYKPDLAGIDAAIGRLFWPDGSAGR